jgi:hypothetical protein
VPFNVGSTPSLLAAYTCTPLVQIPLDDLKPGAKVQERLSLNWEAAISHWI